MTTFASVPVTVTPEAAARIAALGFQTHIERMIEHVRQVDSEVERIEVILYDRYELGDEPGLAIDVYSKRPFDPADRTDAELTRWVVTHFPPEVLENLILDYHPGAPHAG
jgi:hypothetical protein